MSERKPAESRRREIADAALKVIAEGGLRRFTAQAIAREVGLSDGAVFRHFATKDEIVEAAIERVEAVLFEGFPPEGADPVERLGRFFRERAAIVRENPAVGRLVSSEELLQAAPPAGVARLRELRRRSVGFVRACVAEAHARGLLDDELDPGGAAMVILGSLFALVHVRGLAPSDPDAPSRTWAVLERLLRGPRRPPRRRTTSSDVTSRRPQRRPGRRPEEAK